MFIAPAPCPTLRWAARGRGRRELGIPVLKHLHHVWPHYAPASSDDAEAKGALYLLVHGWCEGKFAVLKHEPDGPASTPRGWDLENPRQRQK